MGPPFHDECNGEFEYYIVYNGELWIQQLRPGDTLHGVFLTDEFDWSAFDADDKGYLANPAPATNYFDDLTVEVNENHVKNLSTRLNDEEVVVVIENIDGFLHAFDGVCHECLNFVDFFVENGEKRKSKSH